VYEVQPVNPNDTNRCLSRANAQEEKVISRIHHQLGTAGFVISIVALIAALGGGAYAASGGFSAKQKKVIRKIAESMTTPGPQGPAGSPGSQGAPGPQGAKGDKGDKGDRGENGTSGTNGTNGTNGIDGENVSVIPLAAANGTGHCEEGGAKFTNGTGEAFACNGGAGGGGDGYPETLPSGRMETGFWEAQGEKGISNEFVSLVTMSFPLELEPAPAETVLITDSSSDEEKTKCPGEAFEPKATPGVLCLYLAAMFSESLTLKFGGAQTFGANLFFEPTDEAYGSWAVEAA
jgi:hypothetical protein